mgnify:CR=1 FL=1
MAKVSNVKESKKILIVGPNPDDPTRNGGVAKYMEYLEFVARDWKCGVVFQHTDIGFFSKIGAVRVGRVLATLRVSLKLIFAKKIRLIHVNCTLSKVGVFRVLPLLICSFIAKKPCFLQVHGGRWSRLENSRFPSAAWRFAFTLSSAVGVFPGIQLEELEPIETLAGKLYPIRNFVEPKELKVPSNSKGFNFIFVGRLVKEKGIRELLQAFSRLRTIAGANVHMTILGSGPLLGFVEESRYNGVDAKGHVEASAVSSYLDSADAFVLPSYHEGFPLSFLEAGAKGVVPIVTNSSALPSFFNHEVDCIFVSPKNIDDLYLAMKRIYEDTDFRRNISNNIYKHINEGFVIGSEPVTRQFIEIYSTLLGEKVGSHG